MNRSIRLILCVFSLLPFVAFSNSNVLGTNASNSTSEFPAPVTSAKKPNPKLDALIEKAYEYYRDSKDEECEKTIAQILKMDIRNRDAYLLRANLAMFNNDYNGMWDNLDKVYKYYPAEPEVYAKFAVTHLNYMYLSDSFKRVLCRKTIKLASRRAEGYSNLGMVAMAGGYFQDAINCFDISYTKSWQDTLTKVYLDLFYARSLYGIGDTLGAIERLDRLIPRIEGNDKYTSIFLRTKYKLDLNRTDIKVDLDTLNDYAPDQPDVLILNAKYFKLTNRPDSACMIAKQVWRTEGGELFDMSEFCSDLQKTIFLERYKKLTYALNEEDFIVNLDSFSYCQGIQISWEKGLSFKPSGMKRGKVTILSKALDSAYSMTTSFTNGTAMTLSQSLALWLSRAQYAELVKNSYTRITGLAESGPGIYKVISHEQVEVFNAQNKEIILDCVVITDGVNKITYLNDLHNPMIIKVETETFSLLLTKFE